MKRIAIAKTLFILILSVGIASLAQAVTLIAHYPLSTDAVDTAGAAYVTGWTYSTDFPTLNPYQTDQGLADVFVTKLSSSGRSLVYSTYLGGTSDDGGLAIALDAAGAVYITGQTYSTDFPTLNPYQTYQGGKDVFVTKISGQSDLVVLVHGWHGNAYIWGGGPPNLKSLLEAEGWTVKHFNYPSSPATDWNVPISTLAGRLNDSLETWCDSLLIAECDVNIIAHSMGGLISRYLLAHPEEFTSANNVQRLVTLGTPNYGAAVGLVSGLPGTLQGIQMKFGSNFLWDLHEDWEEASIQAEVLCIAGARNNYTDPHDDVLLLPSACLENLGHPSCYIPNPHSGADGMAYIKDVSHPSYVAIKSLLEGQTPPSNEESVSDLTEGILIAGLFDTNGDPIPVGTIPFLGLPRVWWDPNPTLYWIWPWWPWLSSFGYGVNSESGKYYATGADTGTYEIDIYPSGGYSPIINHPVTIEPRQTRTLSLTVYPANESATASFASGDTPPVTFGNTGVAMDFSSGPGGDVWVYRFDDNPPAADSATLPHYWDIITDMPADSFSVTVTFDYNEAETLAVGISEDELDLAYYDSLWHPMSSVLDTIANKISATTTHLTLLFTITGEPGGCCNGDGMRGNVDDLSGPGGDIDVADLTYLVAYLFTGGPAPACTDEGNVDGIVGIGGPIDVADLTYLVAYLFIGGPPPPACP